MHHKKLIRAIVFFAIFDACLLLGLYTRFHKEVEEIRAEAQENALAEPESSSKPIKPAVIPKQIHLLSDTLLRTGHSVKSVLFDPERRYLYSMNLEDGSVYAFDRKTKKLAQKLFFDRTPANGYDYEKRQWVKGSFAEKPVEAIFSHEGKYLWISWHNGDGVVAWNVRQHEPETGKHGATLHANGQQQRVALHYFPTGSTPKVMALAPNGQKLYVANWHAQTISMLDISGEDPQKWLISAHLKVGGTPRGLCFANETTLLAAQMGAGSIVAISADSLKLLSKQFVGPTPRHLINAGEKLYATLSSAEQLAELAFEKGKLRVVRTAKTADDPRTVVCSPDGQLLFVACYGADLLQVFRASDFRLMGQFSCKGSPVGLDVWQEGDSVEVWVANYRFDTIKVLRFRVEGEAVK